MTRTREHREVCAVTADGRLPDAVRLRIAQAVKAIAGQQCEIIIRNLRKRHSDAQRAYWWGVVVPAVAQWQGQTADDTHADLVYHLLPELRRTVRGLDGGPKPTRASYADLTSDQASELVERAWQWAAENGIDIPSPRESGIVRAA